MAMKTKMKSKLEMTTMSGMKGQRAPARQVKFDDDDTTATTTAQAEPAAAAAVTETVVVTETVAAQPEAAAAKSTSTAISTTVAKPQPINKEAMADMGFEGLSFGHGAFPQIVLTDGQFECSTDQAVLGKQFECLMTSSRAKHIYKSTGARKEDEDFFYSYDKEFATDGTPVVDLLAIWKEKGWGYEIKTYLDVTAQVVNCPATPAYNGKLVLLSIPPTSLPRFSGHVATMQAFGKDPRVVPSVVSVGPKVTKTAQPFYPWQFDQPR
jgi:hypothetical protein